MTNPGTPRICDGVPITGAQNLNKLFKGQRQERRERRGYKIPHTRAGWIEWFRRALKRKESR